MDDQAHVLIVEDVIDFFDAFEGIDRGFSTRASEVAALLVDPSTAYVVVSAARHDPLREATWIGANLRDWLCDVQYARLRPTP